MLKCFESKTTEKVIPIVPVVQSDFDNWLSSQAESTKRVIFGNKFTAESGSFCLVFDGEGVLEQVLLGLNNIDDFLAFGALPQELPSGCYEVQTKDFSEEQLKNAAFGWGLGSYQFSKYKTSKMCAAKLLHNVCYDAKQVENDITNTFLVRDLVNTPSGDLHPQKFADIVVDLVKEFGVDLKIIKGEELIRDFPTVYAVGRGSVNKPLLIDLHYGDEKNPKVVLIGKGVCFDSGGLQIKSAQGMRLMKKDMGGAAHALVLAKMIIEARLPINLRLIIPVVENLVSGDSVKPGDIIKTRKGLSVEVAHTDAEGRLILADALALASEWQPDLILDFATLTGAARIALGPDIVALFANDNDLAQGIISNMQKEQEPVWQMPLYHPYLNELKTEMADFRNIANSSEFGGGAIIAALFLEQFVSKNIKWAHLDIESYNPVGKPGKPEGGDACCLRGVFKFLKESFNNSKKL